MSKVIQSNTISLDITTQSPPVLRIEMEMTQGGPDLAAPES